jgi:hypothetical protein
MSTECHGQELTTFGGSSASELCATVVAGGCFGRCFVDKFRGESGVRWELNESGENGEKFGGV